MKNLPEPPELPKEPPDPPIVMISEDGVGAGLFLLVIGGILVLLMYAVFGN